MGAIEFKRINGGPSINMLKRVKQRLQKLPMAVKSEGSQWIQRQEHNPDSNEFQESTRRQQKPRRSPGKRNGNHKSQHELQFLNV